MKGILVLLVFGLLAVSSFAQDTTEAGDVGTPTAAGAGDGHSLPATTIGRQCAVDPPVADRVDCGALGIMEPDCLAKGCCWSQLTPGVFGPWCFSFIPEATDGPTTDPGVTGTPAAGDGTDASIITDPSGTTQPDDIGGTGQTVTDDGPTVPAVPTQADENQTQATQKEVDTEAPTKPGKPKDGNVLVLSSRLISNPPFLLEKKGASENDTGRERYEGIIPDVMEALTNELGTDFDIKIVKDGMFGIEENGEWTGMVGEVARQEANMSGPMRVTNLREQAVDFTYPIIRYEAMLVMRKRHWNQEPKIESLEDLLAQDKVKYGVLNGGDIERHILSSKDPQMVDLYKGLKPATNKDSNKEGVKRARDSSDYVFIVEGVLAKLLKLKKPCDLQFIPAGFYHRQYAMAVPNLDPLRDRINNALVEIKHSGEYNEIFNKWYGEDECASALSLHYSVVLTFITLVIVKVFH